MVVIGVDPHKGSHTAVAIDEHEQQVARVQVRSGPRQVEQLLAWADEFSERVWAVESAGGLGLSPRAAACRRGRTRVGRAANVGVAGAGVGGVEIAEDRPA